MKKSELRNIIRELIKENLEQEYPLDELTFATVRQFFPEGEIAFPNADDSSRIVRNKEDLEDWKKITRNSYGNVKIVFNPKAIWYDQVKVKDENFIKDKEMSIQAKAAFLDRERKSGRTTGFD